MNDFPPFKNRIVDDVQVLSIFDDQVIDSLSEWGVRLTIKESVEHNGNSYTLLSTGKKRLGSPDTYMLIYAQMNRIYEEGLHELLKIKP